MHFLVFHVSLQGKLVVVSVMGFSVVVLVVGVSVVVLEPPQAAGAAEIIKVTLSVFICKTWR